MDDDLELMICQGCGKECRWDDDGLCPVCYGKTQPKVHFSKEFTEFYHPDLDSVVTSWKDFDRKCDEKDLYCLGENYQSELDGFRKNKPDATPKVDMDTFMETWKKAEYESNYRGSEEID